MALSVAQRDERGHPPPLAPALASELQVMSDETRGELGCFDTIRADLRR